MKKLLLLSLLVVFGCSKESDKLFWERVEGKNFLNMSSGQLDQAAWTKFNRRYGLESRAATQIGNEFFCSGWNKYFPSSFLTVRETTDEAQTNKGTFYITNNDPLIVLLDRSGSYTEFQEFSYDEIMKLTNKYNCD